MARVKCFPGFLNFDLDQLTVRAKAEPTAAEPLALYHLALCMFILILL